MKIAAALDARTLGATLVALAAHALLLMAATFARSPRPPMPVASDEPREAWEISLVEETQAPRLVTPAPVTEDRRDDGARSAERIAATNRGVEPETTPPETTPTPPLQAGGAPPIVLFSPDPRTATFAMGPNPFVGSATLGAERQSSSQPGARSAAPEAPSAEDAKRNAERALKDPLRGRDASLGLGPEGPVLRALEDAAYRGLAPERGGATFLAVVDTRGFVIDLRIVSTAGGTADGGWRDTRARAARALAGVQLALRGAKGAELTIRVESDVRLPSGNRPRAPVSAPVASSRAIEAPPNSGLPAAAEIFFSSQFDVTDVGAKPRRIVHARLVALKTL